MGSTTIAKQYGIKDYQSILNWVAHYRMFGINSLKIRHFKLSMIIWKL